MSKRNFKILILCIASSLLFSSCVDSNNSSEQSLAQSTVESEAASEGVSEITSEIVSEMVSEIVSEEQSSLSSELPSEAENSSQEEISEESSAEISEEENEKKTVKLFIPDYENFNFQEKEIAFDGTVEEIVNALAKENIFSENVKVNSFKLEDDTITIDLSQEFGNAIATGTLAESMILGSFVNTLLYHFEATQLYFTVEGNFFDSGHVYYDFPLIFTKNE